MLGAPGHSDLHAFAHVISCRTCLVPGCFQRDSKVVLFRHAIASRLLDSSQKATFSTPELAFQVAPQTNQTGILAVYCDSDIARRTRYGQVYIYIAACQKTVATNESSALLASLLRISLNAVKMS